MMADNAMSGEELNRRLNTIAVNAVREAQIALGRAHLQWCDDDWRRMNMIAQILNLSRLEDIDGPVEHYALVAPFQAPKNPRLDGLESKLADALANLPPPEERQKADALAQSRPKFPRPGSGVYGAGGQ